MSHDHHHTASYNRAFAIGIALNIAFVIIEFVYGSLAGSLALIADAGHNLSDVLSLFLAWFASLMSQQVSTDRHTYGYRKLTIMAPLASAIILLIALGGIAWEALGRLLHPQNVQGTTVIVVAAIGVVINTITALLFVSGQKYDLNLKAAFLHMAADAAVSFGVVIAGVVIIYTGWLWLDPVISIVIVLIILGGTWGLLRDSLNHAIDAVPASINIAAIRQYFLNLTPVTNIHDLHVWPLSTTETALTVHLVVNSETLQADFLSKIQRYLHDNFDIDHSTIQIEQHDAETGCMLDKPSCIE